MPKFQGAMRRVITGDNAQGQSVVIFDGGPSSEKGNPDMGEMFEISITNATLDKGAASRHSRRSGIDG